MEDFKILKDLVKFNTIKDKENKEIIDYIEKILLEKGLKTEYKGKYLIMFTGKETKLGFLGHTDTVEYIEGWTTNPFELTLKENKLYGLGTADMKGGIAAMMDAVIETNLSTLKHGIKLYFTYDEEISFGGIYDIVKTDEKFPEFMLFGEPTDNEMLVGSKGIWELDISFNGIKAHSSTPEKGKSANLNAVKFIYELEEFYNKEIKKDLNNSYEVPYTTMNVGLINGESAKNSIPANCEISIDFRTIKSEHSNLLKEKMNELSYKYDCAINIFEEIQPFYDGNIFIKYFIFLEKYSIIYHVRKCKQKLETERKQEI